MHVPAPTDTHSGDIDTVSDTNVPYGLLQAQPYRATEPPRRAVLGYYTLSTSVLSVGEVALELAGKLPRFPQLPVTLIGRLAVDVRLEGQGCVEYLVMNALRSLTHSTKIAAMAMVVEAKDETAAAFFRHFDFEPLQTSDRRL